MKKNKVVLPCLCIDEDFIDQFLLSAFRAEYFENPRVFMKSIRSTLIALGYYPSYINGEFREYMEKFYSNL